MYKNKFSNMIDIEVVRYQPFDLHWYITFYNKRVTEETIFFVNPYHILF